VADAPRRDGPRAPGRALRGRASPRLTPTDRYGILLFLLFVTFVFMAAAPSGPATRITTVVLQGLTLLAAVSAAGAHRRLVRIVVVVAVLAFAAALVSLLFNTNRNGDGVFFGLNALLVGAAPVVIARSMWQRRVIDIQTVLAAVCVYVLVGMLAAFAYGAIADLSTSAFFAQQKTATPADYLYFSFVTLTTVGYGDLTAAKNLGRAFSALEAMVGQLYLVTVVAVTVGRLSRGREDGLPNS
jgi:Ion channel